MLAGGKRVEGPGFFFPPTIITNLTRDMKIWTEEVFFECALNRVIYS